MASWIDILTLLGVGLGFFFIITTKMRQTEKGRRSTDWFYNLFKRFKTPKVIEDKLGRTQFNPPQQII